MTATRFYPPPAPTVEEAKASGTWQGSATFTLEDTPETRSVIEQMLRFGQQIEADRREAAAAAALEKGVGLRIEVYGWHTEYWLDPDVPAGEIHEHVMIEGVE